MASPLLPPPPTPRGDALFSLQVENRQRDLSISSRQVKRLISTLYRHLEISSAEITVYFISKRASGLLHGEHFDDPNPTDCMTFPLHAANVQVAGELFVCPRVAIEYGNDPYEEVSLYLVHALLHLLGYDDLTPKKRQTMRKKEKHCMRYLRDHTCLLRPFSYSSQASS